MKTSLAEKVVVVTGSSIGIGAAIAEEFARHGAKVVITYNSHKAEAEKIKTNCERLGAPETFLSPLDVTSTKSIESLVEKVVEKFGQIDILVNNAGVLEKERWKQQLSKISKIKFGLILKDLSK